MLPLTLAYMRLAFNIAKEEIEFANIVVFFICKLQKTTELNFLFTIRH